MVAGKIVEQGDKHLAMILEKSGYTSLSNKDC
jgi:Fe-S cluster assembly ATPase SufC